MTQSTSTNQSTKQKTARFLNLAQRAGSAIGTVTQDNVYGQLILGSGLNDSQRERLGYATHMIARAKQAGNTSSDIWRYVQSQFNISHRYFDELSVGDTLEIGTLAYALGACQDDDNVEQNIRSFLNNILNVGSISHDLTQSIQELRR